MIDCEDIPRNRSSRVTDSIRRCVPLGQHNKILSCARWVLGSRRLIRMTTPLSFCMLRILNDGFNNNNNRQEWVDPHARANYSSPLQSKGTTQFPLNIIWQFGSHHKTQWGRDSYCTGFHYLAIALNRCSMFISSHIKRNPPPPEEPTQFYQTPSL